MGGGSGGGSSTWDKFLRPYIKQAVKRGAEYAYGEERPFFTSDEAIAGFDPMQEEAFGATQDMYETGDQWAPAALGIQGQGLDALGNVNPITSGFQGQDYNFGTFGQSDVDQRMSDYARNVTDIQERAYVEDWENQQNQSAAGRVSQGSRGGMRDTLSGILAGDVRAQGVADIRSKGQQDAYLNAQNLYENQRQSEIKAAEMGQYGRVTESEMDLRADEITAGNQLAQAQGYRDFTEMTRQLGITSQQEKRNLIAGIAGAGQQKTSMEQIAKDYDIGSEVAQWQAPMDAIQFITGLASGAGGAQTGSSPAGGPDIMTQLIGAGLAGAATFG